MANAGAAVGGLALLSVLMLRNCDTVLRQSDDIIQSGPRTADDWTRGTKNDDWWKNPNGKRNAENAEFDYSIPKVEENRPLREDEVTLEPFLDVHSSEAALEETIHGDYAVVKGTVTSEDAARLRMKGVKFVCDESFQNNYVGVNEYKVIFVYSEDIQTLKTLYGVNDEQAQDIKRYAAMVDNNTMVQKVSTKEELEEELENCAISGERPVLIFHNRNNTLFDVPIASYGVSDIITCNSYQIPGTSFMSTDFINLKYVLSSVNKGTKQVTNLAEFYRTFSGSYSELLQRERNFKVIVIATVAGGTAGGVGLIIYYNKD